MKRTKLVCAALAAVLLLSSCSHLKLVIRYAGSKAAELTEGHPAPPAASAPSPDAPVPSPEETPNVDAAIEGADESLGGEDIPLISDLSVAGGISAPPEPKEEDSLAVYAHYKPEFQERYRRFLRSYPDMTETTALALVNVNADYGYYKGITQIQDPDGLLVFCNKNYQLPAGFAPENLRAISGYELLMTDEAATAFEDMRAAVKKDLGKQLIAISAYRSFSYQKALFARYARADGIEVADTYSARAGHSEHQTGLTIDLLHTWPKNGSLRNANFQDTEQYAWMLDHAHEYGFILRYPETEESVTGYRFEPWHWRYIGADDASKMHEEGIATFEEYIGTYYRLEGTAIAEAG
ncbi:MAG: M15 family metallopeptidase [Oscillospiraceae bacterium]|jgi:D-alanyl-D-alanine carboxypeptidase|nr:M15 family metallopeptidase [Oscillospiraceae bacterium]